MVQQKRFEVHVEGDVTVVRLKDPALYEMILISELHDELLQYVEQYQPRKLLVDFSAVNQCSSAVINSMLLTRKRMMGYDAVVRLCSMHPQVREAFRVLRLEGTLFQIYDSLPQALESFSSAAG
jgi:anti-anti-sigma regulatory factor